MKPAKKMVGFSQICHFKSAIILAKKLGYFGVGLSKLTTKKSIVWKKYERFIFELAQPSNLLNNLQPYQHFEILNFQLMAPKRKSSRQCSTNILPQTTLATNPLPKTTLAPSKATTPASDCFLLVFHWIQQLIDWLVDWLLSFFSLFALFFLLRTNNHSGNWSIAHQINWSTDLDHSYSFLLQTSNLQLSDC